jgi:Tfp pilus assembly protein PilF
MRLRFCKLSQTSIPVLICLIALSDSPMASANATLPFAAGDAALSEGRYEDARREFSRIITSPLRASAKFEAFLRMGLSFPAEDQIPKARAQFEQALKVEGITEEQIARAEVKIGETHVKEMNYDVANVLLEKVLHANAASLESKIEARLLIGKIFSNYGSVAAWTKVKDACAGVIALESAPEKARLAAHSAIVPALISLREFKGARLSLEFLARHPGVPLGERVDFQIELARTLWLERLFPEARSELARATSMVGEAKFFADRRCAAEAEIQLLLGLTFYDEKDFQRAKIELSKVLSLPGQSPTQKAWREAYLRLRLRNLIASDEKELKVFFIGSSHTLLGNIPLLVEQLASSAPAGTPRIISGDHARMGTGMRAFWSQGDAPDTPRGKIAAEPWDVIVVETFYRTSREDLAEFGDAYAALARSHGSRLVIYESPASKSLPYPDGFSLFHASNIWLGKRLDSAVAPSVHAWLKFFGASPTEERFKELYRDGIHATAKGAYLTACCLYAALTGLSPERLWHPAEMREQDALVLQQIAWLAFSETQQAILNAVTVP